MKSKNLSPEKFVPGYTCTENDEAQFIIKSIKVFEKVNTLLTHIHALIYDESIMLFSKKINFDEYILSLYQSTCHCDAYKVLDS